MSDQYDPPPVPSDASSAGPGKARGGWWFFFAVLVAPAVLTLLAAKSEDLWPVFTFAGSGVAGLYCGFWLAIRQCRTIPGKVLIGLILAVVFTVVSFALCCAGCTLGGASFNLH